MARHVDRMAPKDARSVPRSLAGRRVLVEIDCRDHDCNAAIHNIFFNLAF